MGDMLCTEIPFDNVYGFNCIKGPGLFTWSGDIGTTVNF